MTRALFVTWDSPQTTYLESLFFPLFAAMRGHGVTVDVLQFTWGAVAHRAATAEAAGLVYQAVRVPAGGALGAAFVLARGPAHIRRAFRGGDVLYPRSLLPLAASLRVGAPRLVFDADGLVADERVDFAGWSADGLTARWYRDLEARGVRRADAVITRTERARDILLARAGAGVEPERVVAIPNGKDPAVFHPGTAGERASFRRARGVAENAPWAIYAGSIGPQYHLDEMLAFHRAVRMTRPDARLTLLTRAILEVREPGVEVVACPTDEVPRWLRAADLGLAWRTPSFSMAGVCPIKVAEYLLSGLPVLANRGIGDLDRVLGPPDCLLLDELSPPELARAAGWWAAADRDGLRVAARARGERAFGLAAVAEATAGVLRRAHR